MKFYVYEWFNVKTSEIFYVGKGCNKRATSLSHRNKLFKKYISENQCDYRIAKHFENEDDAFNYEHKRIIELKKIGQATCNLDYGGVGGCNFVWTSEMREYKSQYNPMKSLSQRERMKNKNPMKNKEINEKVAQSIRKPVIIGGIEYKSVREAAKTNGVSEGIIITWCKKGVNDKLQPCKYKNKEQVEFIGKRYNKGCCKPLLYKGKYYESPIDVARELNISNSTVCLWAKKGFDANGNPCKYIDDNKEYIFKPFIYGEAFRKPIKVNGIIYPSKREAEKAFGLKKGGLSRYIAGEYKKPKYVCEYVNQQPSQEKSDNSILEGSTTNG